MPYQTITFRIFLGPRDDHMDGRPLNAKTINSLVDQFRNTLKTAATLHPGMVFCGLKPLVEEDTIDGQGDTDEDGGPQDDEGGGEGSRGPGDHEGRD